MTIHKDVSNFNSTFVLKKRQEFISMRGKIPKNFCWITLVPGEYIVSEYLEKNVAAPTFMDLFNVGLLMAIYRHPFDESCLLLLPALQPVFIVAKTIHGNTFFTDGSKVTHIEGFLDSSLEEIDRALFNGFKLG